MSKLRIVGVFYVFIVTMGGCSVGTAPPIILCAYIGLLLTCVPIMYFVNKSESDEEKKDA